MGLLKNAKASLSPLTGGHHKRFYIPGFYELRISRPLQALKNYLLELYDSVIKEIRKTYPWLKHFRIGLILSMAGAGAQSIAHYDYDDKMRTYSPELRAVSCLMAIDGFSFSYWGDNGKWQKIWCPEGTWLSFTSGCLHFGSANPFPRNALRAFLYCVSDPADFPDNHVYPPRARPAGSTIGCEEDQDPTFVWDFN